MEDELRFLDELTSLVKQKPELSSLDDSFVRKIILQQNLLIPDKYKTFEQFKKSAACKKLVSQTRKLLREIYGVFIKKPLGKLSLHDIDLVLQSHQSTKERYNYLATCYNLLFDKLFSKGLAKDFSLLDIACGFTPFTLSYFPIRPNQYIACDLSSSDMNSIAAFFNQERQQSTVKAIDVLSEDFLSWVKNVSVDVCFLFKALDSFEHRKRHSSKAILTAIPATFLVVSFSLVSLGGKASIGEEKRSWFERFCTKQGWTFETMRLPNELFYIVLTSK